MGVRAEWEGVPVRKGEPGFEGGELGSENGVINREGSE